MSCYAAGLNVHVATVVLIKGVSHLCSLTSDSFPAPLPPDLPFSAAEVSLMVRGSLFLHRPPFIFS